jgi:RNA polymerase sigma-70 factor (ECF subfamily)
MIFLRAAGEISFGNFLFRRRGIKTVRFESAYGNGNQYKLCQTEDDGLENVMALPFNAAHASQTEQFESRPTIVKFAVVKDEEQQSPSREGEPGSFEEVMLPHLDAAHNLARWLLRNEQDAQDVVQEAYLRAFKSFGGFHGSNGRAWLLTIVRNTSYTLLKKNKAVDLTTPFDEETHGISQESHSPVALVERIEDAGLIKKAIDELPAEFREILVLRHQEGLSYKEIADIAKIPPGTVMSRLARARAKLKEGLSVRISQEK